MVTWVPYLILTLKKDEDSDDKDKAHNIISFKRAFFRQNLNSRLLDPSCYPKFAKVLKLDGEESHILRYKRGDKL